MFPVYPAQRSRICGLFSFYRSHSQTRALRFVALAAAVLISRDAAAQLNSAIDSAARQPGEIAGELVLPAGQPAVGVTVALTGTNVVTQSDAHGRYHFSGVQPGTYEIVADGEQVARVRITDVVVQPNTITAMKALALAAAAPDPRGGPATGDLRVRAAYTLTRPAEASGRLVSAETSRAIQKTDTPVELSPFVVSTTGDVGWLANDTMLANRTNQPLKDVPVTIDAMTQEFLLEVGAFDAFAAAEWTANAFVASESSGAVSTSFNTAPPQDSNRFAFRGIPNEAGPTRNLFLWRVPSDTYNVERIDFGRGSNSLLFGDVEPGGQGNIYSKRAAPGRSFGNVLAQVDSLGGYRLNLDYNLSKTPRLAFRLNLTRNVSLRDFDFNRFALKAVHGAATFRLFPNTILRAEAEVGVYNRIWGSNNQRVLERSTPGLGYSNAWTLLPDNSLVRNAGLLAIDRQGAPAGATLSLRDVDPRGFPRHYNWSGPNTVSDRRYTTFSTYVEQRIADVGIELSYNQQIQGWDDIATKGNNLVRSDATGRRFIDFAYVDRFAGTVDFSLRAMITYKWAPAKWLSQLLVGSAELRQSDAFTTNYIEVNRLQPGLLNAAAARIYYRVYIDEPGAYQPAALGQHPVLPETSLFSANRNFGSAHRGDIQYARAYSLSANGAYFGGRLQSSVGLRLDNGTSLNTQPWGAANRAADGEAAMPASYYSHPEQYSLVASRAHIDELSENYGLVYKLNKNINMYTVWSTSFRAANGSAVNFAGDNIGQQRGQTFEVGLKSDFFDRRMVWNLNWYDLARTNVEFQYNQTGVTEDELQELFNPAGLSPNDPKYVDVAGRREQRKQFSRGIETTLVFYPGKGINIRLSGAWKKVTQDESMPRFKALLAAAVDRGGENPAHIAAARAIVEQDGGDGLEVSAPYAAPFSGNYAANYMFDRNGPLNGWSVGLNGTYLGRYVVAYIGNRALRGGETFSLNGTMAYRTRLGNRPATFRLNVKNLVENDSVTRGIVQLVDRSFRNVLDYSDSRTFTLTATVDF
jgi:outer membrane receptor protein involved in Fe transport